MKPIAIHSAEYRNKNVMKPTLFDSLFNLLFLLLCLFFITPISLINDIKSTKPITPINAYLIKSSIPSNNNMLYIKKALAKTAIKKSIVEIILEAFFCFSCFFVHYNYLQTI